MNREEYQRVGHLFVKTVTNVRKYAHHAEVCTDQAGTLFLCHLEGHGDIYWRPRMFRFAFDSIIIREGAGIYEYLTLNIHDRYPQDHERYKEKYPWYNVGFQLARKKKLYVGDL